MGNKPVPLCISRGGCMDLERCVAAGCCMRPAIPAPEVASSQKMTLAEESFITAVRKALTQAEEGERPFPPRLVQELLNHFEAGVRKRMRDETPIPQTSNERNQIEQLRAAFRDFISRAGFAIATNRTSGQMWVSRDDLAIMREVSERLFFATLPPASPELIAEARRQGKLPPAIETPAEPASLKAEEYRGFIRASELLEQYGPEAVWALAVQHRTELGTLAPSSPKTGDQSP